MTVLNLYQASALLGIDGEILEKLTQYCPKFGENNKLQREPNLQHGLPTFKRSDLEAYDRYLWNNWPVPQPDQRANIPEYFKSAIRRESEFHCAVCPWTDRVEIAHIKPWSDSKTNHPHNLIALCPNHHTQYDYGYTVRGTATLTVEDIERAKKDKIRWTTAQAEARAQSLSSIAAPSDLEDERIKKLLREIVKEELPKLETHVEQPTPISPQETWINYHGPSAEERIKLEEFLSTFWRTDWTAQFLENAFYNIKTTFGNYSVLAERIRDLNMLWVKLGDVTKSTSELTSTVFFFRAHSDLLAAMRLGFAGQFPECYCILKNAIIHSLYAVNLHNNPEDSLTFLRQDASDSNKAKARKVFREANLLEGLAKKSQTVEKYARALLHTTRQSGEVGQSFEAYANVAFPSSREVDFFFLGNSQLHFVACLKTIARVQVFGLLAMEQIYPERLLISGISHRLRSLMTNL